MKQRYEELEMEVIAFETDDVIGSSDQNNNIQDDNEGPLNPGF